MTTLPFARAEGVVRLGAGVYPCAELSTGELVFTGPSFDSVLGDAASKNRTSVRQIERIVSGLLGDSLRPRLFVPLRGGRSYGFPVVTLPALCDALIERKLDNKLHPKQEPAYDRARDLLRALGRAAIETMVADACGIPRAPGTTEARVNELLDELATERARGVELAQRVDVLEARVANAGVLGERYALANIEAPLLRAAALRARALGGKPSRHLRGIRNRVERATGHCRKGDTWASFPAEPERVSVLRREVRRELLDAEGLYRAWCRQQRDTQPSLFGVAA